MAPPTQTTESQVWKAVSDNTGFTATQLKPKLKSVSKKELVDALNTLLAKDLVKVSKTSDNKLTWTAVGISDAKAKNSMAGDERMVFAAIEAGGNQGIWTRTISTQTNLPTALVTKILSKLLSSKQIKSVKSVKFPTRKMFMAAHIEPSVELTGGPWYTDFELDSTFISFIRGACLNFVIAKSFPDPDDHTSSAPLFPATTSKRYPTLQEIAQFLRETKLTDVNLLPEHIDEIMNVLVYEGVVEKLPALGSRGQKGPGGSDNEDSEDDRTTKQRKRKRQVRSSEIESDVNDDQRSRRKRSRQGSDSDSDDPPRRDKPTNSKRRKREDGSESGSESDRPPSRRSKKSQGLRRDHSEDEPMSDSGYHGRKGGKSSGSGKRSRAVGNDEEEVDLDLAFGHIFHGGSVYRAVRQERIGLGWSQAPCGKCPQVDFCEDGGPVNPTGCKYYAEWLSEAVGE
ncbi:34-kDa subunit of RNA polymerase III (C) [Tulasnella sp. 330]|nr:34-kDa subunit of RNA polymerase III (C) [Tulasnella sp. 330]KAG8883176.1 34-kDa subunit of RNA polymerase III (C) [Tulasnella sp. 331]KAG8888480.1 34-kDa subunit of RNA polymerase III (C) [Tulasnella sp. 332]